MTCSSCTARPVSRMSDINAGSQLAATGRPESSSGPVAAAR